MSLKMIHEYSPSSSGYTSRILSLTRDPSHSLSRSPPSFKICSESRHLLHGCIPFCDVYICDKIGYYASNLLPQLFFKFLFDVSRVAHVPVFHFIETVLKLDNPEHSVYSIYIVTRKTMPSQETSTRLTFPCFSHRMVELLGAST